MVLRTGFGAAPDALWDFGTIRSVLPDQGGTASRRPLPTPSVNGRPVQPPQQHPQQSTLVNRMSQDPADFETIRHVPAEFLQPSAHAQQLQQSTRDRYGTAQSSRKQYPSQVSPTWSFNENLGEDRASPRAAQNVPAPPAAEQGDAAMLDAVILPAIDSVRAIPQICATMLTGDKLMGRVPNDHARMKLDQLRRAFAEAEQAIPGVTAALVLEIVENVEQVDEH